MGVLTWGRGPALIHLRSGCGRQVVELAGSKGAKKDWRSGRLERAMAPGPPTVKVKKPNHLQTEEVEQKPSYVSFRAASSAHSSTKSRKCHSRKGSMNSLLTRAL